jgi:hypothetical protein
MLWEFALHYPDRRHSDANVFGRLQQRLGEIGSITPMALVNADSPRTVRTPAKVGVLIAAVE